MGAIIVPSIRSSWFTQATAASTDSITATMPATIKTGDLIFAVGWWKSTFSSPNPSGTGFTLFGKTGNSTSDAWMGYLYRIADGTEGATAALTFPRLAATSWTNVMIFSIGAGSAYTSDSASWFDTHNPASTTGNTTIVSGRTVTTSAANSMLLHLGAKRYGSPAWGTHVPNSATLHSTLTNGGADDGISCKIWTETAATAATYSNYPYYTGGTSKPSISNTFAFKGNEKNRRIFIT